jgi:hypothetical protein
MKKPRASEKNRETLTPATRLVAPADIVSRDVQGETVLLNLQSGTYFGLNESGTFVWQRIKKGVDFKALLDSFESEYDVTAERAEKDLRALVGDLRQRELIQLA